MLRMMMYEPAHARVADRLKPYADQVELLVLGEDGALRLGDRTVGEDEAQPQAAWLEAEAMTTAPVLQTMLRVLMASPQMTWLHTGAAGVDHPMWRPIVAKGVLLTTSRGQAVSIAEYVMGEVLAHYQHLGERRAEQAAHRWTRIPFVEIAGGHWLIVGFGAIGQALAQRARAFGASITAVRRSGEAHPLADRMVKFADVKTPLGDADVVVLAAPLNPETRNMADTAFFAAMKPGSVLVNIGRGDLLDEAALLAALDRGAPGHAVLDVFHEEPLPADSPFWDHPRVALNSHASGFGSGQIPRNDALFLENLGRRLTGEPLLNIADPRDLAPA